VTDTEASARLSDDGIGPSANGAVPGVAGETAAGPDAARAQAVAPAAGSGLTGLAERAARLGGTLSAGAGRDGGFWLRVSVPLTAAAGEPAVAAATEPAEGQVPS
jgi:two-component system sensor histidine kinase DesK